MKRLSIDPQIKSAFSGYHEQVIRIMSEQDKSSQLRSIAKITTVNLYSPYEATPISTSPHDTCTITPGVVCL